MTTKPRKASDSPKGTWLERDLPWAELSLLAEADRRSRDPVYAAHRWWARRPPAVMRGLLLAAAMPPGSQTDEFWASFADAGPHLAGLAAYDPFAGGGSTLVEAQRLGASVSGRDVDPLAVLITNFELDPPEPRDLKSAAGELLASLSDLAVYYPRSRRATPLHYFFLRIARCPGCEHSGPLYRSLVLARDVGKVGAVVRDAALTVFCPTCFSVHDLDRPERLELRCCGKRHRIAEGTFAATRYECPACQRRWNHTDLKTGRAERMLIAVEETLDEGRRRIRQPTRRDREASRLAAVDLKEGRDRLDLPNKPFANDRRESRPLSYGVSHPTELFSDRQLLVLGKAFRWVRERDLDPRVGRGITLALSNALSTNNLLCGYASDYGRLSALFSVRSYSMPALGVELNALHPEGGRGTIPKSLQRVIRSTEGGARRHVWSLSDRRPVPKQMEFPTRRDADAVECRSAADPSTHLDPVDLCISDPPYYDFISYSELSEFHRAWLGYSVTDEPLLPEVGDELRSFAMGLGDCLRSTVSRLKPGHPLAFTYHATSSDAWEAVGLALDEAKLVVTALWPLRNDGRMGHHSYDGNCEWDVVVVARRLDECERCQMPQRFGAWRRRAELMGLAFNDPDEANIRSALKMAASRFGRGVEVGR